MQGHINVASAWNAGAADRFLIFHPLYAKILCIFNIRELP